MQPVANLFQGIIRAPRVSDEEYEDYCRNHPEKATCQKCNGAGMLQHRLELGRFEYRSCQCRLPRQQEAQQIYSGLLSNRPQTFENFKVTPGTREAFQNAHTFATGPTRCSILTIRGGVGTGKTHLLQSIGWVSLQAGRQPKFVSVARYLDRLRATFSDDSPVSFEAVYRPLEAAQVLLLDDIGAERMTSWGQEQLYKIVNYRYQERLAMAVSMNLDEKQAVDIYGERTADRLLDTNSGRVRVVSTGSRSYRTNQKEAR